MTIKSVKNNTAISVPTLRRLGYVAIGRVSAADASAQLYDEIMRGSIPAWAHRQLFQSRLSTT